MGVLGTVLVGLVILAGLVGVVLPVLPGAVLVLAGIVVWGIAQATAISWLVVAVAAVWIVGSQILKYVIPTRRLRESSIPGLSLLVGGMLGILGFFVVPVIGLLIGFVAGVYAMERQRLDSHHEAWPSTITALRAVGLSILIELAGALFAAATWLGGVVLISVS